MQKNNFNLIDAPGQSEHPIKAEILNQIKIDSIPTSSLLSQPVPSELDENTIAEFAIDSIRKKTDVSFGDLRLGTDHDRIVVTSDRNLSYHHLQSSSGIGIRVLVDGFWGFSSTQTLTEAGIKACIDKAVQIGRFAGQHTPREYALKADQWAEEPTHQANHTTPILICPISEPTDEISKRLIAAADLGLRQEHIKKVTTRVDIHAKRRLFASTEGSRIHTKHAVVDCTLRFHAVTPTGSAYRTLVLPSTGGGLEHFYQEPILELIPELCADAVKKTCAQIPATGTYDLILDGHNLALTMHESVGHPTELDRVLGYEFGFAGGSFIKPENMKTMRYGTPIVNFSAKNNILFGAASQGFDDEGVEAQEFPIISEGILVNMGTCRETAHKIGLSRSNGCSRATHWYDVPIVRIPNLFLEPGRTPLSKEDLIADTKSGILMLGRDSFSIDQMRYNFQFGSNMAYRIENGKITEPLKDVIYQSISPEFWQSCDAICDASEWQMHGVFNCGKGQPMQSGKMMHGAAPARFRNIKVGF